MYFKPKWPVQLEFKSVSVDITQHEICFSLLNRMLVHCRVSPCSMSLVPIYGPLGEERQCGVKFANYKSDALTTTSPHLLINLLFQAWRRFELPRVQWVYNGLQWIVTF